MCINDGVCKCFTYVCLHFKVKRLQRKRKAPKQRSDMNIGGKNRRTVEKDVAISLLDLQTSLTSSDRTVGEMLASESLLNLGNDITPVSCVSPPDSCNTCEDLVTANHVYQSEETEVCDDEAMGPPEKEQRNVSTQVERSCKF